MLEIENISKNSASRLQILNPQLKLVQLRRATEVQRYKAALAEVNAAMLEAQQHFSSRVAVTYGEYMRNNNV